MEGPILPRGSAGKTDAPLLRRTVSDGRDKQHVLSYAQRVGFGCLGQRGSCRFQVRAQSAATNYAHATAQRRRRFGSVFSQDCRNLKRASGSISVSVAAVLEEGP